MESGNDRSDQLFGLVYDELRIVARGMMRNERPDHTLGATALVHEAYLRLKGSTPESWKSRAYFCAAAAEAMRRILVDHARRRKADCHGGGYVRIELGDAAMALAGAEADADNVLAIDEALSKLSAVYPSKARLVKLLYFGGLSLDESAAVLGDSRTTIYRQWVFARAWLRLNMVGCEPTK
jgi:RNA polymerase sigma factor (TIGR02999 family)